MRWSLFLGLVALVPSRLEAAWNIVHYNNYCIAFSTCASVRIVSRQLRGGGSVVDVFVRNLEGSHPAAATGAAIGFFAVGSYKQTNGLYQQIGPPNGGGWWGRSSSGIGKVGNVYGVADALDPGWEGYCDPGPPVECYPDRWESFPNIVGCSYDPATAGYDLAEIVASDPTTGYEEGLGLQTCVEKGFTGWAFFSFGFNMPVYASDIFVDINDLTHGCRLHTVRNDCQHVPLSAVPEPSTWALLVTGLLGLGFVSYRKRRRE